MAFDGSTLISATTGSFFAATFSDTFAVGGNDVDMIRLDLTAGNLYRIDVDNGTAGDLNLRVFDAFGTEVRGNDDGFRSDDDVVFSLSPYIEFVPNHSGPYVIAVSPFYLRQYDPATTAGRVLPENPLGVTAGTLTVSDRGPAFWSSAGSIGGIAPEGPSDQTDLLREADGSLRVQWAGAVDAAGDVDLARIDLAKGDVVVIDVNGLAGNGTVLRVFDDTGAQIGFDDDAGVGEDAELTFTAPVADDYYIGISGEGNAFYAPLTGADTAAGAVGDYTVIAHRNPTGIGSSLANLFDADEAADYLVGLAGGDTLNGNDGRDTLAGGDDNDSIRGGAQTDMLYGEQGDDQLFGDGGRDILSGGIGADTLEGGAGADLAEGGDGNDRVGGGKGADADTLRGDAGDDRLSGAAGDDSLDGGAGVDLLLAGTGNDLAFGGLDADTLNGGSGDDALDGGSGNDVLTGAQGNDSLSGGSGDDALSGAQGADTLEGGSGNDTLTGGAGADVFRFLSTANGVDLVADLALGTDRIDLSAVFAGHAVTAGNLVQFVQVTPAGAGADAFLGVDVNGAEGGLSFVIVAQVAGVTPAELFDFATFIV